MSHRVLSGLFSLAISLALVGAAVTAREQAADAAEADGLVSFAIVSPAAASGATPTITARVPLRSADLDNQTVPAPADVIAGPQPVAVRIEALGLEAEVLSVGVDENNLFDVPAAQTVGWYKYGAAPGQAGSTVLAAHVDYAGRPGAFFDLGGLATGETLEVELLDGTVARYRVVDNTLYDKTALPANELFRKGGDEVIRLITCGGEFDPTNRSYLGNVVVTAEPIEA